MEDSMEIPKKLEINPSCDPAIPLQGMYPEEIKMKNTHVLQCSLQHYLQ